MDEIHPFLLQTHDDGEIFDSLNEVYVEHHPNSVLGLKPIQAMKKL